MTANTDRGDAVLPSYGDRRGRRIRVGATAGASAKVASHCCMSTRSASVSGVVSVCSLLLNVAAAVVSVGSFGAARRERCDRDAGSPVTIEQMTASRS